MVLFPASDGGGVSLYQRWMDAYEKYLYQQMYDNFERERNEQATVEEVAEEPSDAGAGGDLVQHTAEETLEDVESVETNVQDSEDPPMAAEAEMAEGVGQTPLYSVDGYIPDEAIQTYLYTRLCEAGIGWFHPYAICLIAQESTWNPMAENRNGLDKGLLQYRISYWPTLEWWNPYAEIDVFVAQMANRANSGKTVSEMISAHNQSDYGPYCQSYVDAVMQHSNALVQIR